MRAVVVDRPGGPEVMNLGCIPAPEPGPDQALVHVRVAGVNFMDTQAAQNRPAPGEAPFVPGVEGAGVVAAVGEGAGGGPSSVRPGDRVAWTYAPGSYAEQVVVPVDRMVPLPDGVSFEAATSLMMQGITAHYFATAAAPVEAGRWALVHSAAGGVGSMLVQLLVARGARVVGVVSDETKAHRARAAGAEHVVVGLGPDLGARILAATGRRGVDTVYDSGGTSTFAASVEALPRGGRLATFGALNRVPQEVRDRVPAGVEVVSGAFTAHVATRERLLEVTGDLFALTEGGALTTWIGGRFPLDEARRAHEDMLSRRSTGKLLLVP